MRKKREEKLGGKVVRKGRLERKVEGMVESEDGEGRWGRAGVKG